jgi:hypothetical protein
MHYMCKFFKTNGQIDHNHVGTGKFELDVAQAGVDGRARSFAFDSRDDFCRIIATLRVGSADVAGAPHVQPEDEPDGGRAYSHEFLRTFGDPDGHHLMPGARGWTIYRLVDGARTRLCGRESWGMGSIIPDAVGIPEDGHPLSGERDATLGFSKLLTSPRDTRERRREAETLRAYEQTAKAALVAEAGHSDGAAAAADAVTAVVALCGKRHKTLDEEFAPQLAAARGALLAACPTLQKKLDDYLERSKVLAMHDARAQVLGGLAAAAACLDPESQAQLALALAQNQPDEVQRLRKQAGTALYDRGAAACLPPESQAQLALALAQNQPGEVQRLRKQARTALSDTGAAACLPPESQAQLALALAQNQPGEVERLRKQARTARFDKSAAACLDPESQGQLALARADGRADVEADLLAKARAKLGQTGGTAVRSTLKATGCKITIAELTPTGGREGKCILKASRDEKNERFRIDCSANDGVFGDQRFELNVPDKKSGAKADNLGNIINLPLFVIKRRDERRFECKFTEINAMANLAASSAGVDEAEAVVP